MIRYKEEKGRAVVYRIPTSGRRVEGVVLGRTRKAGSLYVQPAKEPKRWIPDYWVLEIEPEVEDDIVVEKVPAVADQK